MEPRQPNQSPVTESESVSQTPPYNPDPIQTPELPPIEAQPAPLTVPKKSHIKPILIISIIAVVLVAAGIAYYLFALKKPDNTSTGATTAATQTAATSNASVQAITKSLTDSSTSETTLTNTDDSSQAASASTSAGSIGDSVDENNF